MSERSSWSSQKVPFRSLVILALGAVVATGLASFDRPWKRHQLAYLESLDEVLKKEIARQEEKASDDIRFFQGEARVAEDGLKARAGQIRELEADLFALGRRLQEAEARRASAEGLGQQRSARLEVESLSELQRGRQAELDALVLERNEALERLAKAGEPVERLRQRRDGIRRDAWIRAIPGLRGWAPSIQVRQGQGAGSDRCVTCHLGMDEQLGHAGVAEAAGNGLFAVHPSWGTAQDLSQIDGHRLASCSACHGGDGRSTDFHRSGHDVKGADPILAGPWIQSSCVSCHPDEPAALDGAPVADLGRQWVDRLACRQCHGDSDSPRGTGPSLTSLSAKLLPEWVETFVNNPDQVHGSAFAPALWKSVEQPRRTLEARAAVAYLWQGSSSPAGFEDLPGWAPEWAKTSDARRGRDLFDGLGCAQCHSLTSATEIPGRDRLLFGPSLEGLGQKVSPEWLVRWLQKPRLWHADTSMPDFRLTREEVGHLGTFLLGDRLGNAPTDGRSPDLGPLLEAFDPEQLDQAVLEELEYETTLEDAQARLERMGQREKALYLGRRVVERRNCFRCHATPGFDEPSDRGRAEGERRPPRGLQDVALALFEATGLADEGFDPLASHPLGWTLSPDARRAVAVELLAQTQQTTEPSADAAALMRQKGCFSCHLGDGEPLIDAPSLRGIGGKVKSEWLHGYLSDPGSYEVVRPWLERRMPSFHLSEREADVLLRYFIDQADVLLFENRRWASADPQVDRVVGRAAFEVLQCSRCHWQAPDVGLQSMAPAPDYASTAERLRRDWVHEWILDPGPLDATGTVPDLLPQKTDGSYDTSALRVALFAPMFQLQRLRIEQVFDNSEELEQYLADEARVARAVALYLQDL